jgi:hypothetical protein
MTAAETEVAFYIPASAFRHEAPPARLADYREWVHRAHVRHFSGVGKFNWILQTHLHLVARGLPSRLSETMPREGVVITHRYFLPDAFKPNARQLIVCTLADKEEPGSSGRHPFAQLHALQNPLDPMLREPSELWPARFIPFWTQIDLVPRAPERGDRFEHAAFFGIETNLAPELKAPAFTEALRERGMTFSLVSRQQWHDYSAVDVVLAIRSFDGETYHWKPATKLFNAWRAGVPAIVGPDSAYEAARKGPLDFLRADSVGELHAALRRLADSPSLRREMAANGRERAREIEDDAVVRAWQALIADDALPRWRRWCAASDAEREGFFARRAAWSSARPQP